MDVSIYSREQIERIIAEGKFPKNTAVISFYDPAIKRIDKAYSHVDYSKICNTVFYSELDDLDLEILGDKGYTTYDTHFLEADDIAAFVYRAYDRGLNIICQCEYGQSRSAGCAAAILEHFYHAGMSVFGNYKYYPNQVVYHKVYDALEKQKRYHDNRYYYAADVGTIKTHLAKMQMSETLLKGFTPEDGNFAVDLKYEMEYALSERHMLYHTAEEIINALMNDKQPIYASFTVADLHAVSDRYLWEPHAVCTYFKYGCEKVGVVIWFDRVYISFQNNRPVKSRQIGYNGIKSLSFFGKLSWDDKRKIIDAIPIVITNIHP